MEVNPGWEVNSGMELLYSPGLGYSK